MKKAFITGITGQDGSFLAEWLLKKNYHVIGFARQASWQAPHASSHLTTQIDIYFGDITRFEDIHTAIATTQPDEIYHLASQSRPGASWTQVNDTLETNGNGTIHLFEAVRRSCPQARVYHASSSEMYGRTTITPQNETTPFEPVNPYAAAKVFAHHMARIYRDGYQLFIASGILFNHESERRPLHFVTQKIAYGAACAALGIAHSPALNEQGVPIVQQGQLALGHLKVARDWGYAPDFIQAMWLMLQQPTPDEFVIGTGQLHTLSELCDIAYRYVGCTWTEHVIQDATLIRPIETLQTIADPSKAARVLKWKPSTSFNTMIEKMVQFQIDRLKPLVE